MGVPGGALAVRLNDSETVFNPGEVVTIGRSPSATMQSSNGYVGREHVRIAYEGGTWVIEDLQTKRGTYYKGTRISRLPVTAATTVWIGGDRGQGDQLEMVPYGLPSLRLRFAGKDHVFSGESVVTVGRGTTADVSTTNGYVSRDHARIFLENGEWVLEDLDTKRGTYHSGVRIPRLEIRGSTTVFLGGDRGQGEELQIELISTGPAAMEPLPVEAAAPKSPPVEPVAPEPPPAVRPVALGPPPVQPVDRKQVPAGASAESGPRSAIVLRLGGQSYVFPPTKVVTVGRDPTADVRTTNGYVSHEHVRISYQDGTWILEDLSSKRGTYQRGARVSRLPITGPTTVWLGEEGRGEKLEIRPREVTAPLSGLVSSVYRPTAPKVRIGRASDNEIALADDLRVSRHHAELVRQADQGYQIVDLGSHNGTFVNGQRVERRVLLDGDIVTLGNHLFQFANGELTEYLQTGSTLEAVGLTVEVGPNHPILENVSLFLEPSSLLAVVGPSGSGKTTLLNALIGTNPAKTGSVFFGGRDLYASFDDLRQQIGFVPQDDILHPQLPVRRALEFAAQLRFPADVDARSRSNRVDEVLHELDLASRADVPIERLSGGQRKRVSVALELLTKPILLFLDEPTSGLDPGNEQNVMSLLRRLADGGRTVIVVTHSTQSLHLCDRVLFLAPGGKMAYFGPPNEALGYFQKHGITGGYPEIFSGLEERDAGWASTFMSDTAYQRFIERPLGARAAVASREPVHASVPPRQQPWVRQLGVLVRRYLALIRADRKYLLLLLLQAPVLGVVLLLVFAPGRLSPEHGPEALILVLSLVLGITWVGMLNAVREIVKELPIYKRERAVGLSVSAYIGSKVAVLGSLTALQAVIFVFLALLRQSPLSRYGFRDPRQSMPLPPHGALLPSPLAEAMIDIALAGIAAMSLGLLLSALAKNADKAITLVPILLVPQLIFAGGLFPVQGSPIGPLSFLSSAQWGMSATASTLDLNTVQLRVVALGAAIGIKACQQDPFSKACRKQLGEAVPKKFHASWRPIAGAWFMDVGALFLLSLIPLCAAYVVLRRRDRHALSAGAIRAGPPKR